MKKSTKIKLFVLLFGFIFSVIGSEDKDFRQKTKYFEKLEQRETLKKSQYKKIVEQVQKVVILNSTKSKNKVLSLLKSNQIKIVAEGERFFVIRPSSHMTELVYQSVIKKIEKDKNIASIQSDRIILPRSREYGINEVDVSCQIKNTSFDALDNNVKNIFDITKHADNSTCFLFPHCANNSNPAWARMQIGADLADEIVEDSLSHYSLANRSKVAATIGVIDSGFDNTNHRHGINALSLVVEKGHSSSGDPEVDPDGHGTSVSGMVSGKGVGVTKNVNLRIYRVTEQNANGGTSNAFLAASIEKACEKSEIVNVSWGSIIDEIGFNRIEDELWYKKAAKKGCLIIKSAGNSGVKRENKYTVPLEAPFLSVAASDQFAKETTFSTKGMVTGPGEGVFSLLSHQHEYSNSTLDNVCKIGNQRVGPINGTSFAAPAVSGVAGQVLTILKARKVVPKDPRKKVSLLKSILLASTKWNALTGGNPGQVNALAASLIAKEITAKNMTTNLDRLISIGKKATEKHCSGNTESCELKTECEEKKNCTNILRFHVLACFPKDEKKIASLFKVLESFNESELSLDLLSRLPKNSKAAEVALGKLDSQWKMLQVGNSINDLEMGINLLDSAREKGLNSFINADKLRESIRSISFVNTFSVNDNLGENIWNGPKEALYLKFMKIFEILSIEDQISIIKQLPHVGKFYIRGELGLLYLLNQNISVLPLKVQEALAIRIRELGEEWFRNDLNFSQGTLAGIRNTPVFDMFLSNLSNGKKRLEQVLSGKMESKNIHLFSYAISSDNALTDEEKLSISKRIIHENGDSTNSKLIYIFGKSMERWIELADSNDDNSTLKDFLLNNHLARLPLDSIAEQGNNAHKVLGGDKEFWKSYLKTNIRLSGDYMENIKPSEVITVDIPTVNVFSSLTRKSYIDDSLAKEIMVENRSELIRSLFAASKNRIKFKVIDYGEKWHLRSGADSLIDEVLRNSSFFEKHGMLSIIAEGLLPLKLDIQKNPSDYSQSLRQRVNKIYDLNE